MERRTHGRWARQFGAAKIGEIEECNSRFGQKWVFMQDGAPCHMSPELGLAREMRILPGWLAQSPDLNPIEMLWAVIGKAGQAPAEDGGRDLCGCRAHLDSRFWNEIDQPTIDGLVRDFARRCDLVLACNGNSISQLLSSHITEPRSQDVAELVVSPSTPMRTRSPVHLELRGGCPDKWVVLAEWLPDYSPQALKHRYTTLKQLRFCNEWAATRQEDPGTPVPRDVLLSAMNDVVALTEEPAQGHGYIAFAQAQRDGKPELCLMGVAGQANAIAALDGAGWR